MDGKSSSARHAVQTASGSISYIEQGTGPVALFVHGVLLNGHLWRHQLAELSGIRRCIAVDRWRTATQKARRIRIYP